MQAATRTECALDRTSNRDEPVRITVVAGLAAR